MDSKLFGMLELELDILSGGYHHCTSQWNRSYPKGHGCYKFYFPISGEVLLVIDSQPYHIKKDKVYFINAYRLQEQIYRETMDVYWLHFVPRSLLLSCCLAKAPLCFMWDIDSIPFEHDDFDSFKRLFDNPSAEENKLSLYAGIDVKCHVTSILLYMISSLLTKCDIQINQYIEGYNKLLPAVDFINQNFYKNIQLFDIAEQVHLHPVYFLRLFKQILQLTPMEYIKRKRMESAFQQVITTNRSIADIAEKLGYCSQFYFSQVFKQYYGLSPNYLRNSPKVP
jgi:AraC-like DNA-binding protein